MSTGREKMKMPSGLFHYKSEPERVPRLDKNKFAYCN